MRAPFDLFLDASCFEFQFADSLPRRAEERRALPHGQPGSGHDGRA